MFDVAIYRHQLFKRSEPFIEQQAAHLPGIRPIMVGRERWGDAPAGMKSVAMSDSSTYRGDWTRAIHAITRDARSIVTQLQPFDIRLVHAHFGVEGVYAQCVARRLDVPLVTTFHGFDVTTRTMEMLKSGKPSWVNYLLNRRSLARSGELFLCVSNFIREKALAQGFPEERTKLHYIGVDTEKILPPVHRRDNPTLLHVGRLVEKKGCRDLIRAFAALPKRHAEWELTIVGDGPLRTSLTQLATSLGVAERVSFMGARSQAEVLELMGKAAILCQPSITARTGDAEGLPMVILEGAASGLPVIGTYSGGIAEAIVDGQTGFLVDERAVGELTSRLVTLMDSSSNRAKLGQAARSHVEKHFNVAKQSAILAGFYKELI
jgi:glycosyltransferase involved in cell wall biosynthesis